MDLLWRIEHHLKATGTAPSRFGRDAVGDSRLVKEMRNGREPRPKTAARILACIEREETPSC